MLLGFWVSKVYLLHKSHAQETVREKTQLFEAMARFSKYVRSLLLYLRDVGLSQHCHGLEFC